MGLTGMEIFKLLPKTNCRECGFNTCLAFAMSWAAGLKICGDRRPLLYAATPENADRMAKLAVEHSCPLAAKAPGLEKLAQLSERLSEDGVKEIVFDSGARTGRQAFEDQVFIRRAAVNQGFKALCFPTITFPCEMADNDSMETLIAAMLIAKYSGIVVLSDIRGETLFPLLLERMELFGDPQEPAKAPAGVHPIGNPNRSSPVLLTSGWALTYYSLLLAAEVSRTPSYLCVEPVEEPDVMCWCHHCLRSTQKGKFVAESTARFIKDAWLKKKWITENW
jgi:acetyl-CoA decarbonylase/synthase complex subunit gamma